MGARLPYQGEQDWARMLTEFLLAEHNEDGTHKAWDDLATVKDEMIALRERLEMLEDEVASKIN